MQAKLLADWAKIDLHGALDAYLGETWDERRLAIDGGDLLSNAFASAFAEEPMRTWNVLAGPDMAMARQLLTGVWGEVVGRNDPALMISVVAEMPATVQGTRLRQVFNRNMTPAERDRLMGELTRAGDARQFEDWIKAIGGESSDEPFSQWSESTRGAERIRKMGAWAASLARSDPATLAAEWETVPEEDRAQAARMLLARVDNRSPVLLEAIDRAIAAGQWDVLRAGAAEKLRGHPGSGSAELLEWALTLPGREEVRHIYNLAISQSLLRDPAGSRQWLESLPPGSWHREAGFVEMVLGNLWVRGDLANARRVAGNITDPRMAQEASEVIYDWQLLMRRQSIDR